MPFQKGNVLGTHKNHKANFKPEIFIGSQWMMRGHESKRVLAGEIKQHIGNGWVPGRPKPSEETRRKQAESGKKSNNPSKWKPGHRSWNFGDKMPETAGANMSAARLEKYGITLEQITEARAKDMSWCSHHRQFEPNAVFHVLKTGRRASRCNACHNKHTPWYKQQFKKQGGLCGICGEPEPRLDALVLDHSHECPDPKHTRKHEPRIGCVCSRDLLCSVCNLNYGHAEPVFRHLSEDTSFPSNSWEEKAFVYNLKWRKGVSQND